jgi:hypothetical protein
MALLFISRQDAKTPSLVLFEVMLYRGALIVTYAVPVIPAEAGINSH